MNTNIIPTRYLYVKTEDIPERIQKILFSIKESLRGLYLYGKCGTGKTHVAYAIANYCHEKKLKTMFYSSTDLLREIKQDFDEDKKYVPSDQTNFAEILKFNGLLIIDDIGSEKPTEWAIETLYAIINKRYEAVYPTIFTSNFTLEELAGRLGDRIVSRIAGSCEVVELQGKDRRL